MRLSCPSCAASHPPAGALPPLVFKRWIFVTFARTPSPECPVATSNSQAIESASGDGTLVIIFPVTWLLSLHSHVGPAKCRPTFLPSLSKSSATGPFSVQLYAPPSFLHEYT